jgi:6-phosphogluconate dehydrogenase (decarboxylating)
VQIGFVGLGKMGGSMVNRIRRDSDHEVVAFDFSSPPAGPATTQRGWWPPCATSSAVTP